MYEKLVFSRSFCTYVWSLVSSLNIAYSHSMSEDFRESVRRHLSEITEKLIFGVMLHGNGADLGALQPVCDALVRVVYSPSPEFAAHLLEHFTQNSQKLFNALVKCPEFSVRQFVSCLCTHALAVCIKAEADSFNILEPVPGKDPHVTPMVKSRKFLDSLLGLIGNDLATNWAKFGKFFDVLKSVFSLPAELKELVTNYYLEKDLIAVLLDFYLGKRSPFYSSQEKRYEMGGMAAGPDFEGLIEIVVSLTTAKGVEQPKITPRAWRCLCTPELVPKYLREGGKLAKIEDMVLKLMFEQRKYSKVICRMLLGIIHDYEVYKMQQYFPMMWDALMIQDSLQEERIEWLLGIPQPEFKSSMSTAYGLASVSSVEDDVITYLSPLKLSPREYPLLAQLWRQRNQYEYFTASTLKGLFDLAGRSEAVYAYLKTLPAPTYQHGGYADWIKGFLDTYVEIVGRFVDPLSRKEKEELIARVRESVDLFYGRMLSEKVSSGTGRYVIGQFHSGQEVMSKGFVEHGLKVSVFEVTTEIYPVSVASDSEYLRTHFDHSVKKLSEKPFAERPKRSRIDDIDDEFMDVRGYPVGSPFNLSSDDVKIELEPHANKPEPSTEQKKGVEEVKRLLESIKGQQTATTPEMVPIASAAMSTKAEGEEKRFVHGSAIRRVEIVNGMRGNNGIVGYFDGFVKVLLRPVKEGGDNNCYFPRSWIKVHIAGSSYLSRRHCCLETRWHGT